MADVDADVEPAVVDGMFPPATAWAPSPNGGSDNVASMAAGVAGVAPAAFTPRAGTAELRTGVDQSSPRREIPHRASVAVGAGDDDDDGFLALARRRRRLLKKERIALESDLSRWRRDAASSGLFEDDVVGVNWTNADLAGNHRVLMRVKAALDARMLQNQEDLCEARAVERVLSDWRSAPAADVGAGANLGFSGARTCPREAWWESTAPAVSTAVADGGGFSLPGGGATWGAPCHDDAAVLAMLRRQREQQQRQFATKVSGSRTSRERPHSASLKRSYSPAPVPVAASVSPRAPLTARDVLAGHAAWLRDFREQLDSPSRANYPTTAR